MSKLNHLLFLSILLSAIACKKSNEGPIDNNPISVDSVSQVATMNQVLGWKIFQEEKKAKPGENILISPFSIQTALLMAQNGANGNTLSEILQVMDCAGCNQSDLNSLHRDLTTLLTQQSGSAKLTVANQFFYDNNRVEVKPPFLAATNDYYNAGAQNVNFDNEQAALDKINGWVKTNTNNKIDKILERISALDVAFLINALHFKADWATAFSTELTFPKEFTTANGGVKTVDFVNADRNFTYAVSADYNLVDIPFKDSTFSLSLIQPSQENGNANWHTQLTAEVWRNLYKTATYRRAMVFFPKMRLAYDNDLISSLELLGVKSPFHESTADFTGMGLSRSGKNIFINQIKHKAVLEVDEKGAEGAAVTSIGFGITSLPPTFWFNKPFVLVLRHVPTNTMIFAGFVADPT